MTQPVSNRGLWCTQPKALLLFLSCLLKIVPLANACDNREPSITGLEIPRKVFALLQALVVLFSSESGCFSKLWVAVIETQSFGRRLVPASGQLAARKTPGVPSLSQCCSRLALRRQGRAGVMAPQSNGRAAPTDVLRAPTGSGPGFRCQN